VVTLACGILGLLLGVLVPTAILLGLVAVVLGVANLRRGRDRHSLAGCGVTAARLAAGMVSYS
jgi:hypothetical protein